jgi:hypothetical protein
MFGTTNRPIRSACNLPNDLRVSNSTPFGLREVRGVE